MTLWGQISLSSPPCLSPWWNHGGVSVSVRAVTLLIAGSQLLSYSASWLKRERGRGKSRSNRERKRVFFHLTQWMSSVNTPWCNWRVSKERRRELRLSFTSEEPTVQLTRHPLWVDLVQSTWLSWQADRASWRTGQHWTDPGSGHKAAVHAPQPGWHWTCWLVESSVCVCVLVSERERKKKSEKVEGVYERVWVFYEHVTVIEI